MRRWLFLAVALLLLLPGCAGGQGGLNILGPEGDDFAGLTVYISEMVDNDIFPTTQKLYSPKVPEGMYFLRRLNEIVRDLGFKITFESIPFEWPISKDWNGDGIENDPYEYKYTYNDYIPKLLEGDAAILFPQYNMNTAGIMHQLANRESPLVREIDPALWEQFAPQWYAFNRDYIAKNPAAVPAGYENENIGRPVLVVREEIANRYGRSINTLDDLEEFLLFCKKEYPALTPALVPVRYVASASVKRFSGIYVSYRYTYDFQDEILSLLSCSLTGYPADNALQGFLGFTLVPEDMDACLLPVEQDPKFTQAVEQLLHWRDEGLVEYFDVGKKYLPNWGGYASVLLNTYCWEDSGAGFLSEKFDSSLYDFLNGIPYILFDGMLPDLRAQRGEYVQNASYLGINASDEAAEEWLSFLEYLHANRENLRSILWGEEGVEYALEGGGYEPLPYPFPDQLKEPSEYDFRYDFKALKYFSDERYPSVNTKLADTRRIQRALDELMIPDSLLTGIVRRFSRAQHAALLDRFDPEQAQFIYAYDRRVKALPEFIRTLLKLPAVEAENAIKEFAREQQKDCALLSQTYSSAFGLTE